MANLVVTSPVTSSCPSAGNLVEFQSDHMKDPVNAMLHRSEAEEEQSLYYPNQFYLQLDPILIIFPNQAQFLSLFHLYPHLSSNDIGYTRTIYQATPWRFRSED